MKKRFYLSDKLAQLYLEQQKQEQKKIEEQRYCTLHISLIQPPPKNQLIPCANCRAQGMVGVNGKVVWWA